MTSTGTRHISDFFHTKKRVPVLGKSGETLKSLNTISEICLETKTISTSNTVENVTTFLAINESPSISSITTNVAKNLKRHLSPSNDDIITNPLPTKRICTSNLVPPPNLLATSNIKKNATNKELLESIKSRQQKSKQTITRISETLTQIKEKPKPSESTLSICKGYVSTASILKLPVKYNILMDTFQSLDLVVSMLYNRNETCFIDKIQPSVESMTRRSFSLKQLGQIVTVSPNAYNLSLEPKPTRSFQNKNGDQRQLTIMPNIPDVKVKNNKATSIMSPNILIDRKNVFKNNLIEITKTHHQKFLASLNPPIIISNSQVCQWHKSFKIESAPDIEPAAIPKPNESQVVTTAKDVLEKVGGMYCKQLDRALETVAANSTSDSKQPNSETIKQLMPKHNPTLKGISQSLLEKIRAKEAAKAIATITCDSATNSKIKMMARLPEIARIVRTMFISERKAALQVPFVIDKIDASFSRSLTYDAIKDHLKMLSDIVPEWISEVHLQEGPVYYKVNREMDFNVVLTKMTTSKM